MIRRAATLVLLTPFLAGRALLVSGTVPPTPRLRGVLRALDAGAGASYELALDAIVGRFDEVTGRVARTRSRPLRCLP